MSPGCILINTARGGCVDLESLRRAQHLGGVGLDVYEQEPCSQLSVLSQQENAILTPHSAGYHPGLGVAVCEEVLDAVRAFLGGEMPSGLVR